MNKKIENCVLEWALNNNLNVVEVEFVPETTVKDIDEIDGDIYEREIDPIVTVVLDKEPSTKVFDDIELGGSLQIEIGNITKCQCTDVMITW